MPVVRDENVGDPARGYLIMVLPNGSWYHLTEAQVRIHLSGGVVREANPGDQEVGGGDATFDSTLEEAGASGGQFGEGHQGGTGLGSAGSDRTEGVQDF